MVPKEKEIILDLGRYSSNTDSTLGFMLYRGNYICDTLEDESRVKKVNGETRIRSGVWELRIREELTKLTKKYRERYDWFEFHIEIISPDFTGTYIHNGTTDDHTAGCPLVGERNTINTYTAGTLKRENNVKIFKEFYQLVYPEVKKGNKYIRITNFDIPKTV